MNDRQENKVSMFYKVDTFFNDHITEVEAIATAITGLYTTFSSKLTDLADYDAEATEDITGYAIQKQINRTTMRNLALRVSGGYVAYLRVNNQQLAAAKFNYTQSELDHLRDSIILEKCHKLAQTVGPINPATIDPYGVTATLKTELENAITAYRDMVEAPEDQKSESAAYGEQVDTRIAEIDEVLITIDSLMAVTIKDAPVLYYQYKYDRKINDNTGGSSTTPDVILTIAPNSFQVVLTVPYLESRSFKAKNKSTDTINWGLSTSATAFTDIIHTVDGGAESTKLSSTLAPSGVGDKVLFQNPSANPIDIELTVYE